VLSRDLRGTPKPDYHSDFDPVGVGVGVELLVRKFSESGSELLVRKFSESGSELIVRKFSESESEKLPPQISSVKYKKNESINFIARKQVFDLLDI
jgi:hypothetical protein